MVFSVRNLDEMQYLLKAHLTCFDVLELRGNFVRITNTSPLVEPVSCDVLKGLSRSQTIFHKLS